MRAGILIAVLAVAVFGSGQVHASPEDNWKKGVTFYNSYQFEKAIQFVDKVVAKPPASWKPVDKAYAHVLLSLCHLNLANVKKAEKIYESALAIYREVHMPPNLPTNIKERYRKIKEKWIKNNPLTKKNTLLKKKMNPCDRIEKYCNRKCRKSRRDKTIKRSCWWICTQRYRYCRKKRWKGVCWKQGKEGMRRCIKQKKLLAKKKAAALAKKKKLLAKKKGAGRRPAPPPKKPGFKHVGSVTVLAIAGVCIAGAVGLGVASASFSGQMDSIDGSTADGAAKKTEAFNNASNTGLAAIVLGIAGGLGAAVGVVLLIVESSRKATASLHAPKDRRLARHPVPTSAPLSSFMVVQ